MYALRGQNVIELFGWTDMINLSSYTGSPKIVDGYQSGKDVA